jgi:hypothetical protein
MKGSASKMADFVQTMKDWRRMCMAMEKLRPDDSCDGCPLEGYGCPAIYEEDSSHVDYADVEKNVTAWAAEHPVVYPTWWEYMFMIGVIPEELGDKTLGEMTIYSLMNTRIQSDIAEKLGLKPEEG